LTRSLAALAEAQLCAVFKPEKGTDVARGKGQPALSKGRRRRRLMQIVPCDDGNSCNRCAAENFLNRPARKESNYFGYEFSQSSTQEGTTCNDNNFLRLVANFLSVLWFCFFLGKIYF